MSTWWDWAQPYTIEQCEIRTRSSLHNITEALISTVQCFYYCIFYFKHSRIQLIVPPARGPNQDANVEPSFEVAIIIMVADFRLEL
jgi:hypothetical protein